VAPRPYWKGYLKLSLVSCSIAIYPATSSSERVSFNQINSKTGSRVKYKKVDADTGDEVEAADIVKGYQVEKNVYVTIEDEEIEALQIESNHTIEIDKFVPLDQIDDRYFDSPYYIVPNDNVGQDAFAVIREAMRGKGMVGLGRVVLSKRERPIILQADDKGLKATTLRYSYEVRDKAEYFADIPDVKVSGEMLKLAEHIVDSKAADFVPGELVDHYENAVVDLIKKKQAGQPVSKTAPKAPAAQTGNIIDLLKRSMELEEKRGRKVKAPSIAAAMPKGKSKQRAKAS
jgi:DNA end-binding protein Ku